MKNDIQYIFINDGLIIRRLEVIYLIVLTLFFQILKPDRKPKRGFRNQISNNNIRNYKPKKIP